jgi:hypothetical protein
VKLRFLISGKAIILRRKPDPRKPFTHTPVARKAPEFGIYNERLGHSGRVVEMDDDMFDHSEQIGELTPGYVHRHLTAPHAHPKPHVHAPAEPPLASPPSHRTLASQGIRGRRRILVEPRAHHDRGGRGEVLLLHAGA